MPSDTRSFAAQVHSGTIQSTVSFLACARLGVLTVIGVHLGLRFPDSNAVWVPLCTFPVSALLLWGWQRVSHAVMKGWLFPVVDAGVAALIYQFVDSWLGASFLGGTYVLLSIVLIGVARTPAWTLAWIALAGGMVVCYRILGSRASAPLDMEILTLAVLLAFTAMLSVRMGAQFRRASMLTGELAEARAQKAAADERLLIARDLHDSVAKSVHGIRMLAEVLRDDINEPHSRTQQLADTLFESADEASREARAVLDGLNLSVEIQDMGAHLSQQVLRWGERTGHRSEVDLSAELAAYRAEGEWAWNVKRALGELLNNVEKHADAESIQVRMYREGGSLVVVLEDDGRGPMNALETESELVRQGHYGLAGIRGRLRRFGGDLMIKARAAGEGTVAIITVPFPRESAVR